MAIKRSASAHWEGTGKEGRGHLTTQSDVLHQTQYSFSTRFADGKGTNPEELIAAAHAGCFTMKLSFNLTGAGFTPEAIDTKAVVALDNGVVTDVELDVQAKVPGMTKEQFDELTADAKANCPISKLLNAKITMKARLV